MPPKDALDSFCGLAVNLDPELVVPVLLQQLGPDAEHAGSWQAKSKALAVMGALLKTEGCEGHADLMREAVADVAALSNAKPVTLGAKAKKLVKELGGAAAATAASSGSSPSSSSSSATAAAVAASAAAAATTIATVPSVAAGEAPPSTDLLGMDFAAPAAAPQWTRRSRPWWAWASTRAERRRRSPRRAAT